MCLGEVDGGPRATTRRFLVDFKIDFRRVYFRIFVIGLTTDAFYWSDWGRVDWLILARQFSGLIFLGFGNRTVGNALMERSTIENQRRAGKQRNL